MASRNDAITSATPSPADLVACRAAHARSIAGPFLTRRELLCRSGMGFASLGLATLMAPTAPATAASSPASSGSPFATRPPHFPGKAKHVIHLFMNGGPSQVDTFDPKPALQKYHGQMLPTENLQTESMTAGAMGSPFKFRKHGQSGIEVSELYPRVAECIDDICVIRSMFTELPNHEPSLMMMNCGESRLVRPSLGSWLTYGLGSENENLPGFVAMCPGGYPIKSVQNWQSAFLPGVYQGTYIDTKQTDINKLIEYIDTRHVSRQDQRRQLDLLGLLNRHHLERRNREAELEARIQTFELASNMQLAAADAFDINQEPQSIRDQYGEGEQARQILMARRLVERGVRFVQIWHGPSQPWDNHHDLETKHRQLAGESDQAIAALLRDLKSRGLLDETLVIWGGEFGRTPTVQIPSTEDKAPNGRDHNPYGFTVWLAGGGVQGGQIYGATDDFGFRAVEQPMHVHDLHATILHLMGLDHEKLTFRYSGRDFRLTDVHGRVVQEIFA